MNNGTVPSVVATIRPGGRTAEVQAGEGVLVELELGNPESRSSTAEQIAARCGVARATAERLLDDSVADAAFPPLTAVSTNGAAPAPVVSPWPSAIPIGWPKPPRPAAFCGLVGELVAVIDPYTEADRTAVLAHLLVAFGNAVGPGPHVDVGSEAHPARLFAAVVGRTSKARKGSSWSPVRRLFRMTGEELRIEDGMSSGEGLISAVRDARVVSEEDPKTHQLRTRVVDKGVEDKRLLVIESELAGPLRRAQRQGNTLSTVMRCAWDHGDLGVLTKEQLKASGAHISIVGHITLEELKRELSSVESHNGFANRFLWCPATRSKKLPNPQPFEGPEVAAAAAELREAIRWGRGQGRIQRDEEASELWCDMYDDLSQDRAGLAGALLARSEAQVTRLSLCYALLARSRAIGVDHLLAAAAFWDYSVRGVEYLFGDATGDDVADAILRELRERGRLTRTQIQRELFSNHVDTGRMARALDLLTQTGQARLEIEDNTGGRSRKVWCVP